MATPSPFAPFTNVPVALASVRRLTHAGLKSDVKRIWGTVAYTGAVWAWDTSLSYNELDAAGVVFTTDHIDVTVSGYTEIPSVQATPASASAYIAKAKGISNTVVRVWFVDAAGALVTTPDTNMVVTLAVEGA